MRPDVYMRPAVIEGNTVYHKMCKFGKNSLVVLEIQGVKLVTLHFL